MTFEQFGILASAIKTYFPRENTFPTKESAELWFNELKDLDYAVASAQLRRHVVTNNYPPTISDIRECAVNDYEISEQEAWGLVLEILNADSGGRSRYEELPEIIQKSLGGYEVFREWLKNDSLNKEIARVTFTRCYTKEVEKKRKQDKLPVDLKKLGQKNSTLYLKCEKDEKQENEVNLWGDD